MKRLIIALAMLASVSAFSQTPAVSIALTMIQLVVKNSKQVYYVQVEATGKSNQQARDEAKRKAIELAVGTVVLGETETDGKRLIRNDIITYSSGVVEDYKIISEAQIGDNVKVVMDVWVSDSRMANRLTNMGASSGNTINGDQIRRDWEKDQSKSRADRDGLAVMKAVLNNYPSMAWSTRIDGTRLVRQQGSLSFDVTIELKLADAYIKALGEAIERYDEKAWTGARSAVRLLYSGRLTNYSGRWRDPVVEKTTLDAFSVPFDIELSFGGLNPVKQWVHNAQEQVINEIVGYYVNSGRKGDLIIDGNKKIMYTARFERPRNMTEDQFVDMVTNFNTVDVRIIDTRRRSL